MPARWAIRAGPSSPRRFIWSGTARRRHRTISLGTCLIHATSSDSDLWRFTGPQGMLAVRVSGGLMANDSAALSIAARAGHGIALLPEIQVFDDLRAGRLFRLLSEYPSQLVPVHIVYPSRHNLAPRTRVVMDFVVEQAKDIGAMLASGAEVLT